MLINSKSESFQCFDRTTYDNSFDNSSHAVDMDRLKIDWDSILVIYNSRQFYNPPNNSYTMILNESTQFYNEAQENNEQYYDSIYKYCTLHEMFAKIDIFLKNHSDFPSANKNKNLICVLGAACPTLRQQVTEKIKEIKLSEGFKVVQIDFCPPYFSDYSSPSSVGYTMSDAFLRLMADDLSFEDFGVFLVPKSDGTLQFRPVERADDLFECTPDHIRRFIELIRKWITLKNNQYYVIVQCFAIPFSFIYSIAVQCDELLLVNQENMISRKNSYNKELSHLLANLPVSCNVRETLIPCMGANVEERILV